MKNVPFALLVAALCLLSKSANGDTLYFAGFKKVLMSDGKDVTKDKGGDSFTEKKVRVKP